MTEGHDRGAEGQHSGRATDPSAQLGWPALWGSPAGWPVGQRGGREGHRSHLWTERKSRRPGLLQGRKYQEGGRGSEEGGPGARGMPLPGLGWPRGPPKGAERPCWLGGVFFLPELWCALRKRQHETPPCQPRSQSRRGSSAQLRGCPALWGDGSASTALGGVGEGREWGQAGGGGNEGGTGRSVCLGLALRSRECFHRREPQAQKGSQGPMRGGGEPARGPASASPTPLTTRSTFTARADTGLGRQDVSTLGSLKRSKLRIRRLQALGGWPARAGLPHGGRATRPPHPPFLAGSLGIFALCAPYLSLLTTGLCLTRTDPRTPTILRSLGLSLPSGPSSWSLFPPRISHYTVHISWGLQGLSLCPQLALSRSGVWAHASTLVLTRPRRPLQRESGRAGGVW